MKRAGILSVSVLLYISSFCPASELLDGIAGLGDSMTDEYQEVPATDCAYNWLEQIAMYRGLNFGTYNAATKSYAYDYGVRGAETNGVVGQASAIESEIQNGNVTLVCMMIGNNDLGNEIPSYGIHNYSDIYWGGSAVWEPRVDDMIENVTSAVNTILEASDDVKLILALVPDCEANPGYEDAFPDDARRQYVQDAFESYNDRLVSDVASIDTDRIKVADIYSISREWITKRRNDEKMLVGGYEVDLNKISDDPDAVIVNDGIHPHTIPQGLMANEFLQAMNDFGAGISLFSEQEILQHAGVPEPATLCLLLPGLALLRRHGR